MEQNVYMKSKNQAIKCMCLFNKNCNIAFYLKLIHNYTAFNKGTWKKYTKMTVKLNYV